MARMHTLLTSPQTLTSSWADVGVEISTDGHFDLALWVKLTINNSNNVQFRGLAKHIKGHADEYEVLSETYSGGVNTEDAIIHELNSDADQKVMFHIHLKGDTPVIQVQARVLTVGATGATLDEIRHGEI